MHLSTHHTLTPTAQLLKDKIEAERVYKEADAACDAAEKALAHARASAGIAELETMAEATGVWARRAYRNFTVATDILAEELQKGDTP